MTQAMVAGRELDVLLHQKVMGEEIYWAPDDPDPWNARVRGHVPHYSTDIAAAWLIVEKLGLSVIKLHDEGWVAGKMRDGTYFDTEPGFMDGGLDYTGDLHDTAMSAICAAALKAVEA